MSYKVDTTDNFKKEAKALAKKYHSLKTDLQELESILAENPRKGTSLGNDVYKVRLQIKSKNKGKSGGARVLTQVKIIKETVYLFSIYDKSEREDIPDKTIKDLIKNIPE